MIRIRFNSYELKFGINRVVRFFILADLTFLAGWGLVDPILAIFVVDKIAGATLVTVGTMAAIYWIVKSSIQIPIALYLDKNQGEKDDFYAVVIGLLIASLSMFSFMAVDKVSHLYLIQMVKAIAFGLYVPAWSAVTSRHLDKDKVAFEWAVSSTAVGMSMGLAGLIGGWLARYGFNLVFLFGGFLSLASALILLLAPDLILPSQKTSLSKVLLKDHRPANIQK